MCWLGLAVGARADLLLVDGDPLVDITATQRIRQTWAAGKAVVPEQYAGSELEQAGIRFLGETTARIMDRLTDVLPS